MDHHIDMRDSWNKISPYYQQKHKIPADFVHYGPHCPNEDELQLIGDVRGKRVLEIGCGGGQCAIAFAKRGAIATGIDLSDAQIEFARSLAQQERVEVTFLQGNIEDLSPIADASQDVVFSAYALQYVERPEYCLSEVRRVLVPGGLLVFSLDHPFFMCLAEDSMTLVRSYHDRSPEYWDGACEGLPFSAPMKGFPRKVGDWLRLIRGAGLDVLDMIEPEPVEYGSGEAWGDYYSPERQRMVPATIIFKARKPLPPGNEA
jgi:ubiquinone/menaquinone biosynthesis C-methylase UbiE